jgi:hypothetical protein
VQADLADARTSKRHTESKLESEPSITRHLVKGGSDTTAAAPDAAEAAGAISLQSHNPRVTEDASSIVRNDAADTDSSDAVARLTELEAALAASRAENAALGARLSALQRRELDLLLTVDQQVQQLRTSTTTTSSSSSSGNTGSTASAASIGVGTSHNGSETSKLGTTETSQPNDSAQQHQPQLSTRATHLLASAGSSLVRGPPLRPASNQRP